MAGGLGVGEGCGAGSGLNGTCGLCTGSEGLLEFSGLLNIKGSWLGGPKSGENETSFSSSIWCKSVISKLSVVDWITGLSCLGLFVTGFWGKFCCSIISF